MDKWILMLNVLVNVLFNKEMLSLSIIKEKAFGIKQLNNINKLKTLLKLLNYG
jgi:hypothetical protein